MSCRIPTQPKEHKTKVNVHNTLSRGNVNQGEGWMKTMIIVGNMGNFYL
jgi:hypothetical protein